MLSLKEIDRLQGIFFEVLEDTSKREYLLYLLCYIQLIRRDGRLSVRLDNFLRCASKNFLTTRSFWKDALVEINLFTITDLFGNVYKGKDIYKVNEEDINFISVDNKYCKDMNEFASKVIRYWGIVNRLSYYGKSMTPYDAIHTSVLIFNEGLFEEIEYYSDLQKDRFKSEGNFFNALSNLSTAFINYSKNRTTMAIHHMSVALEELSLLGDVYYGIDVKKLRGDVYKALKKLQKGRSIESIKIEFVNERRGKSLLSRVWSTFKELLRRIKGGKRWSLMSSEIASYFSTGDFWKRQTSSPKVG